MSDKYLETVFYIVIIGLLSFGIIGGICSLNNTTNSNTQDQCQVMYDQDTGKQIETCIKEPVDCVTKYDVYTGEPYQVCKDKDDLTGNDKLALMREKARNSLGGN